LSAYLIASLLRALANFILEISFYHYNPNICIKASISVILSIYMGGFGSRIATIILKCY